jgi:hypothetical protein
MIVMIVSKPPEYDNQDLRSMIKALIEELRLLGNFRYKMPDENASEEELKTLYNGLRHKLLKEAVGIMHSYVYQFPFDDLFTDEESMLRYLLKLFEQTS